jgi:hypothetical protein
MGAKIGQEENWSDLHEILKRVTHYALWNVMRISTTQWLKVGEMIKYQQMAKEGTKHSYVHFA